MIQKTSECLSCSRKFTYNEKQKRGKFCSNNCQGEFIIKQQLKEGTVFKSSWRKYLKKLLPYCCAKCDQLPMWNNKELTLQVDHIDGRRSNNKIDNLRFLCPNCHTQTDTWGSKNVIRKVK